MNVSQPLLLFINRLFKLPVHPFNLSNDGDMTYAEWQYAKGASTVGLFLRFTTEQAMFGGKKVLDIGCGAAGKSLYYASAGASVVVGLEVLEHYRDEAMGLARRKGLAGKFKFVCEDAADTGIEGGSFDTVIMNDAMEHVAKPEAVLRESLRLLSPGGRLYVNFPPYYHPYGAHLSDAVSVPWVHAFFSEKTLVPVYKKLVGGLPDGAERIGLRISKKSGGAEYFSYINKMTVRRFKKILKASPARCVYYSEEPLRGFLKPLTWIPGVREFFIKMVVAILEPQAQ